MNSRVVALADYRGTPRLRSAVEAYFADKQLSSNTRRAYRQALTAVVEDLGVDLLRRPTGLPRCLGCVLRNGGGRRSPPPGTPGSPPCNRSFPTVNATDGLATTQCRW